MLKQASPVITDRVLSNKKIFSTWWPLAASWMLMAMELPALSAVIARLPNPEIHLAAWGGVIFPVSLIIEAPIIMLLAASTALSKDWDSYAKLRRFMLVSSAVLMCVHILVAFTPLYYFIVGTIIGAPAEVIEPARPGLMFMTVWTWAIAYRRLNQGVLIRFGHSQSIGTGTIVRLVVDVSVLIAGAALGTIPGATLAGMAVGAGVVAEAAYTGFRVRPVIRDELKPIRPDNEPLTLPAFIDFYIPLALTSLLHLLIQPLGGAALSRMPEALFSLAIWPVVGGLVFIFRGPGVAFNEVMVALLHEPGAYMRLKRFAFGLIGAVSILLLLMTATPLAEFWFTSFSGLAPELSALAQQAVWFALPMPALNVLVSFYQGILVHSRRTRGITEAIAIFIVSALIVFGIGIRSGEMAGIFVGWIAFGTGSFLQTIWLWYRSIKPRRRLCTPIDESAPVKS